MKNLKYILITILFFLMLPLLVSADCESDFKKIENDFKATYEYNKNTDDFTITIIIPNYKNYMVLYQNSDEGKKTKIVLDGNTLTSIRENYKDSSYTYEIIGATAECKGKTLKKETMALKKYNKYADSDLCKGNEDFVLCQKEYDKEIDEETFKSRLETYEKSKENNSKDEDNNIDTNTINKENNSNNIFENIISYVKDNLFRVIAIAIFAVALIITIIMSIVSFKKSRRLE